jgi:hypothetical protein
LLFAAIALLGAYFFSAANEEKTDREDEIDIKWIVPPKYYSMTDLREGRIWAQEEENGPWTLFDDEGNILKSGVKLKNIGGYTNGFAHFQKDSDHDGFFNLSGDVVSFFNREQPKMIVMFREGLLPTPGDSGLYGFTDVSGKWVISPDFELHTSFSYFSDGLCPVIKEGKYGFIDRSGDIVIDYTFDTVRPFSEGVAVVEKDDLKYQVIDKNGNFIAEPSYELCGSPGDGLVGMKKDGKVGFVDTKGNVVIDFKFQGDNGGRPLSGLIWPIYSFREGRTAVLKDDNVWIINRSGDMLFQIETFPHGYFNGGFAVISPKDGAKYLIDLDGNRYSLPPYLKSPMTIVGVIGNRGFVSGNKKDQKWGYFIITGVKKGEDSNEK